MSRQFFEVSGRCYVVDDVTGEICPAVVTEAVVPPKEDLAEIIKLVCDKTAW